MAELLRVQRDRFPVDRYNLYVAQASDGDNTAADREKLVALMQEVLPLVQYFAYVETHPTTGAALPTLGDTDVWGTYKALPGAGKRLAMRRVFTQSDIWTVFAELFSKDADTRAA